MSCSFNRFFEDGAFYIYEMGFRLSGEQHYRIIEKQTGINLLGMMLDFAVGKPIGQYDLADYDNGSLPQFSCNLPILLGNGTIAEVNGLEKIIEMPEVISQVLTRAVGDQIEVTGSYGQMFGRFNIVADTEEKLWQTVNALYDELQILSTEGGGHDCRPVQSGRSPAAVDLNKGKAEAARNRSGFWLELDV
ncbi:hypothetical protein FK545_02710 [Planococcus glaciei]|nr:hypothetical protein [Planococcus glaciei]QDY44819.1 hypothetical protein FK545_02710 [Planococcus glaciei]